MVAIGEQPTVHVHNLDFTITDNPPPMSATNDFDEWLNDAGPQGYQEVRDLGRAVEEGGEHGRFEGKKSGKKTIVTAGSGHEALIIASPEAEETFIDVVRERYCDGMPIDGWYEFNRKLEEE